MRISDWSSDVCSSDLAGVVAQLADAEGDDWIRGVPTGGDGVGVRAFRCIHGDEGVLPGLVAGPAAQLDLDFQRAHVVEPVQGLDRTRHLRSEEHTSELQSLMRISYAVFCLKKKKKTNK